MRRLIVASNNDHKIKEIKEILSGFPFEVLSLKEANINIDVEETGSKIGRASCRERVS